MARASGADRGLQEPRTPQAARRVDAELPAARIVRRTTASSARNSPRSRRQAIAAWEPIRTPTAANCCSRCRCRISAIMPSKCTRPAASRPRRRAILGKFLRDVMKLNLDKRNFRLFGPDETASNRLEAVYEVTGKEWMAEVEDSRHRSQRRRPRHGGAERAHVRGLARRLSAHRPARPVLLLRGLHPHHRLRCSISTRNG